MLSVAAEAAHAVGLPYDRIVLLYSAPLAPHSNLPELIKFGLEAKQEYTERRLKPGEARTKLALLLFSSGTTGKPKVQSDARRTILPTLISRRTGRDDLALRPDREHHPSGSIRQAHGRECASGMEALPCWGRLFGRYFRSRCFDSWMYAHTICA